jgi:hypothetical protein
MWKIDFEKIKQDKLDQQYHRPANVGAVITLVIFYKNLKDHYGFGRKRFLYIMSQFAAIQHNEWRMTQHQVDEAVYRKGLDETLYHDYLQRAWKMVESDDTYTRILGRKPVQNKTDREDYNESVEVAYKITMLILTKQLHFGKKRMNDLQQFVKKDMWCILEGRVKLIEFMNMLHESCAQEFGALDDWIKKFGKVYCDDGLPLFPSKAMYE